MSGGFAVDLGGTKIAATGSAANARVIRGDTPIRGGTAAVVARVAELVREACGGAPDGPGVIATAGTLDPGTGVVKAAANLPFEDFPLGPQLRTELGVPVSVVSDTAAGATAEYLPGGAASGCRTGVYVTVSTGIGMALVAGGRLYRGGHSGTGEFGHVPVVTGEAALHCPCGQRGCLEAYASGSGLARRAALRATSRAGTDRSVCGASPTARDIVQSARAGVRWAQVLLNDALDRLAAALAGVVRALDPEALVLGGGLLVNADLFNPLHTRIRNLIVVTVPEVDSIVRSAAHGEMSPLRGALALARCDADALRLNGLGLT